MNCKDALSRIHEFLDGDLSGQEAVDLKKHLLSCPECHRLFRELETTEALVRSCPRPTVSEGFAERLMTRLPAAPRRRYSWIQWVKRHPAITAASVFLLVMMGSFLSLWNQDTQMTVKGGDLDQYVISDDTVYLPAGHKAKGNLMVRGGNVQIDGTLQGNLVVVDGTYHTASTAEVSGKVYEINQAAEWLLYQLREAVAVIAN
ncbi:zf-HC2 domain-containing protein [Gorillibacterium massiliense]|uniref:zf-HC2 domain-containing protein n=1 Tax=Gorillibacterium massiliense TaxID=1280390 RepID=UPI0004B2DFF6|nr:zf-HC2 domain-containing protein [Gorillibacterium massiliense]